MIHLKATKARLQAFTADRLTSGRVGMPIDIEFSEEWDGLSKTIVCSAGSVKRDVALIDGVSPVVPHECMENYGYDLYIGVYGANGDGDIVIPTLTVNLGEIYKGAEPSYTEEEEPDPDVVAQIMAAAEQAISIAQSVRNDADEGLFDGEDGHDGQDGAPGADGRDGTDGRDGVDGNDGEPGQDGFSPYVTVEAITGGHLVSITDAEGTNDFSVMDGQPWQDGIDGSDGSPGADGVGITSIVYDHKDSSGGNVYRIVLTNSTVYYFTAPKGDPGSGGGGSGDMLKADYDSDSSVLTAGGIASYVEDVIEPIESLIPGQASSSNQLADKAFVNSTVGTNTANYISNSGQPFTSLSQLQSYSGTVTNNDYAFVTGEDSYGNTYYDRYKATVSGTTVSWAKEYRLNNSSFTAVQWAAIVSGITSDKVSTYDGYQSAISAKYTKPSSGIPKTDLASSVQDSLELADTSLQESNTEEADELTIDTVVTADSANLVTSGAVYTAISAAIADVDTALDALDALIGG